MEEGVLWTSDSLCSNSCFVIFWHCEFRKSTQLPSSSSIKNVDKGFCKVRRHREGSQPGTPWNMVRAPQMLAFSPFLFQPPVDIRRLSHFFHVSVVLAMLQILDGVLSTPFPPSPFPLKISSISLEPFVGMTLVDKMILC